MLKAIYYPHTEVGSETVLKNALLLWDSLETIVPRSPRPSPRAPKTALLREAANLIVRPRQPNDKERQAAHKALEKMLQSGQLATIMARAPNGWQESQYLIYPDKFLHMTWRMLETKGLGQFEARHQHYGVPSALGFLMMSLLADSCAGTQIQKVTDRTDAYSWLAEAHAAALGVHPVLGLDASQVAPAYDRLVSLSLDVLDARQIPLEKLLAFRQREAKSSSTDYAAMRRRYLSALNAHIKRVTNEAKTVNDLRELERQFRDELRHDLNDLKSELNVASLKTLFSKEVAISTVVTAGTLITPIPGLTTLSTQIGLVGIIPLIKSAIELRGTRRTALLKHTSSWLYLATQPRLQLR
ncbi:MAG: hypothetical protein J0I65_28120 [Variovorax sp.]|nr:hypothetical protein [Variovorax sp.]